MGEYADMAIEQAFDQDIEDLLFEAQGRRKSRVIESRHWTTKDGQVLIPITCDPASVRFHDAVHALYITAYDKAYSERGTIVQQDKVIKPADFRIRQLYQDKGHLGPKRDGVEVLHQPTGCVAQCNQYISAHANRAEAMLEVNTLLMQQGWTAPPYEANNGERHG